MAQLDWFHQVIVVKAFGVGQSSDQGWRRQVRHQESGLQAEPDHADLQRLPDL
jgi:hypothetical protein